MSESRERQNEKILEILLELLLGNRSSQEIKEELKSEKKIKIGSYCETHGGELEKAYKLYIKNYNQSDNDKIDFPKILPIELSGVNYKVKQTSIKVIEGAYTKFNELCEDSYYSKIELISLALLEFVEKYGGNKEDNLSDKIKKSE